MRAKFVDVNGVRTRYLTAGNPSQPPLLLVHGRILTAEHWYCNIDVLGRDFYVVAPDVLGNGFTGPVDFAEGPHPVEQRVAHLAALVDTLGFGVFAACGSSHGALLSTLLHLHMPERLTKLVVNGSAAFASPAVLAESVARTLSRDDPTMGQMTVEGWADWMANYVYRRESLPPEIFPVVMTAYAQDWVMDCWRKSLLGHVSMSEREDLKLEHRLDRISAEALLLWGRNDSGAPLADAERMVRQIPRAHLVVFDECGHMPMMEYPEKFNRLTRDFLKGGVGAIAA